jgi:streptomycin 6-kinase
LRFWGGRGAVLLLDSSPGVLLLERLDASRTQNLSQQIMRESYQRRLGAREAGPRTQNLSQQIMRESYQRRLGAREAGPRTLGDVQLEEAVRVSARLLRRLSQPAPREFLEMARYTSGLLALAQARWERFNPFRASG